MGLSIPLLVLVLSFTSPLLKIVNGPLENFYGVKVLATLSCLTLLVIGMGLFPFLNLGPFSGTWSKVTGKLQSYSVVGKTGSTMSSQKMHLNF